MFGTGNTHRLLPVFFILAVAAFPLLFAASLVLPPFLPLHTASATGFPGPHLLERVLPGPRKLSVSLAVLFATFLLGSRFRHRLYRLVPRSLTNILAAMSSYGFMARSNLSAGAGRASYETQFALKNGGEVGGISNDGNTCFMNSVIQSLASSKELLRFVDSYLYDDIEVPGELPVKLAHPRADLVFTAALRTLLHNVNGAYGTRGKEFSAKPLLNKMPNGPKQNFFTGYNQEDAQEFYQLVMGLVESEYKKVRHIPKNTSESKRVFVDIASVPDYVTGCEQLGKTVPVYVPATHVDPNIEDADHKALKLNLVTPVDGVSAERIGCLVCGEVGGIRYSVMSGISLNLPRKQSYYSSASLQELLDEWTSPEIIDDVNCNRCGLQQTKLFLEEKIADSTNEKVAQQFTTRLAEIENELKQPHITDEVFERLSIKQMIRKTRKSKQIYMSRPPALLSLHINRSVFDPRTYMVVKNSSNVDFNAELDLSRWVVEPRDVDLDARMPFRRGDKQNGKLEDHGESYENETPEEKEMSEHDNGDIEDELPASTENHQPDQPETPVPSNPQLVYQLKAVIAHYGTHNYGHYICYRKLRGTWWRISDESVYAVSEREALNSQGTFMLFFEYNDNEKEQLLELTESDLETQKDSKPLNSLLHVGPDFRQDQEDDLYDNEKSESLSENDKSMDSEELSVPSTAATEDTDYVNGEERAFHM